MPDVVVTVPKTFTWEGAPGKVGLEAWLAEGDLPGEAWSGEDSYFWIGRRRPRIEPGERVYVVCEGRLRGYAPLVRVFELSSLGGYAHLMHPTFALVRRGGAIAVTIPLEVRGFQGFRYRWWQRDLERPFPDYAVPDPPAQRTLGLEVRS